MRSSPSSAPTAPARRPRCGCSATLLRPTGGSARVAGYDVIEDAGAVRGAIGVALQEAALDPLMTGRELIRLQATLHGLPPAEIEQSGRCPAPSGSG